jgi:hypothetical protein
MYGNWALAICIVVLAIAGWAGAIAGYHWLVDKIDGWSIKHEGVDEEITALGRPRAALHTGTQEMPIIFVVPQEWVDEARAAGLQVGRHYATV